jgi:predicted glycogen debranching enzyme
MSSWPRVQVNGRLESAEMEWLHSNGAGAYAMSTVALRHTRRYHGLLVASLAPPIDRYVIVSHAETTVVVGDRSYRLTVHQSPDGAPTPGYRFLESYDQDPIPRWTYRLGRARLEHTIAFARGKNAIVCGYTWYGGMPVSLVLRPLLPMRRIHALSREHGSMVQRVRMQPGHVAIQPVAALPPVIFVHEGVFVGSPDWYRRLEYPEDKLRRVDSEEDLWTPGSFELRLKPKHPEYFTIAVGSLPGDSPAFLAAQTTAHLLRQDPGEEHPPAVRVLSIAADQFCTDECDRPAVVAGYPWLTALARDELIALPGLYLVRGRVDAAKKVLSTLIRTMRGGSVPRRVVSTGTDGEALSAAATLWLFETARQLEKIVGVADPFVTGELFPALASTFESVATGANGILSLDHDGLVATSDDEALPWLDAVTGKTLAKPRRGFTVEHQALWSKGCETLARLARSAGHGRLGDEAESACKATREAFARRFWCESTRYPFDCIRLADDPDGPPVDASIRPNSLVALDVDPDLFERWQATAILDRVRERLVTVRGIRSLDPDDPGYRGEYEGTFQERRLAYYQGLAWTHLLGAYARASLRLSPGDFDLQENLRVRIEEARHGGPVLGHVSEFADGEPPHRPGGCPAHAVSVAELLRTLVWDLGL